MTEPIHIPQTLAPRPYIEALQTRHVTIEQIAEALGLSVRMVCKMKKNNLEPRWSKGRALLVLYTLHCSTASNAPQDRI